MTITGGKSYPNTLNNSFKSGSQIFHAKLFIFNPLVLNNVAYNSKLDGTANGQFLYSF